MLPDDSAYQELHLIKYCHFKPFLPDTWDSKKPKHEHQSFMYNSVSSKKSPSPFPLSQETRETLHLPQKDL